MESRFDTGVISKFERTDEGYLRVWMTVSRVGDLTYYDDAGNKRIERVSKRTLFDKKSLDTAWGKPITYFDHPNNGKNYHLIDSTNTIPFMRGATLQEIIAQDNKLTILGTIFDQETIDGVESGINQVSAGYKADLVENLDGIFDQTNRRYNHFTILPFGRAGESVKVHYDCFHCDAIDLVASIGEQSTPSKRSETKLDQSEVMDKVTVNFDGVGHSVEASIAPLIIADRNKFDSAIKALEASKTDLQTKLDSAQGELERVKGELEGVQTKLDEAQKFDVSGEIQVRMDTWAEVLPSIRRKNPEFKADYSQSPTDIKRQYLTICCDRQDLKDYTAERIDGLYEGLKPDEQEDSVSLTNSHLDGLSERKRTRVDGGKAKTYKINRSGELTGYRGGKM